MAVDLHCWQCGASLAAFSLPLGRRDGCKACGHDLHCCRQCALFDRKAYQQCREPTVEEVRDKERANFCDYFKPAAGLSGSGANTSQDAARAALEKLFGKS